VYPEVFYEEANIHSRVQARGGPGKSQALSVSASGFYEWSGRAESDRAKANRELLVSIRRSFTDSDQAYGSPRVWRDVRAWGIAGAKARHLSWLQILQACAGADVSNIRRLGSHQLRKLIGRQGSIEIEALQFVAGVDT